MLAEWARATFNSTGLIFNGGNLCSSRRLLSIVNSFVSSAVSFGSLFSAPEARRATGAANRMIRQADEQRIIHSSPGKAGASNLPRNLPTVADQTVAAEETRRETQPRP